MTTAASDHSAQPYTHPRRRPMESWRGRLAVMASRGETAGPRVEEARSALSWWSTRTHLIREMGVSAERADELLDQIEPDPEAQSERGGGVSMTIRAKNRTPAALAAQRPQRPPVYTQAQLRVRRQAGHIVTLGGGWSLTADVSAICGPLAEGVAAAPNPPAVWREVDAVALAIHGVIHDVVGLIVQADAEHRTRHLGLDDRPRSIRNLVDLAPRPALPEINDEALTAGTWAETLVALAEPYSDQLSGLLGRALTDRPSERVLAGLRDVDRAALTLQRRLDQATAKKPAKLTNDPTDPRRADLAALGIAT